MSKESWLWLAAGLGYGAMNTKEVLIACPGGPKEVAKELGGIRLEEILTQKQAEKLASSDIQDYALMLKHAEAQGIHVVPLDDARYPKQLYSVANPPPVLFVKGDVSLLNGQLSVGMVGARKPSGYGVEVMRNIGRGVALGGAIIVSGLASGLDSEAHKAALAVNGPTIACVAFGHNSCYPAQNKKLMEVIEQYGAVISEYPPNQKPEKAFFLHRNRLIAGLSHALVVVEARRHSGTMSTVNFATDYGRDVFAVPGSVFSELSGGTNAMIREGAYVAACAADIMSLYGIELPEEDLSKLAAKQAKEGRPEGAYTEGVTRVAGGGVGEQTLLEAIQGRLPSEQQAGQERVSREAAIEAFRRLQQDAPPSSPSAISSQNRALEEMAAAVSDDIMIQNKPSEQRSAQRRAWEKQLEDTAEKETDKVRPFSWDRVERLTKEDLQKSDRQLQERARQNQMPSARPYYHRPKVPSMVPVAGVSPVAPPQPTPPVAPQTGIQGQAGTAGPAQGTTMAPHREQKTETKSQGDKKTKKNQTMQSTPLDARKPKEEASSPSGNFLASLLSSGKEEGTLAGNLRTMQRPAEEKAKAKNITQDGFAQAPTRTSTGAKSKVEDVYSAQIAEQLQADNQDPRSEDKALESVSDEAKIAFAQLGINPSTLAQIVEKSGLSSGEAMAALTELELAGLTRQLPGRKFSLIH